MSPVSDVQVAVQQLAVAEDLLDERSLHDARLTFDAAEGAGADPDRCSAGRWEAAMLAGRFEDAWRESDKIRSRAGYDPHRFWNGEPIDGKRVIVRSLHGLGDAVQMFRYAPFLRERAREVIYEVPPRMLPLARYFRHVENVVSWGEHAPATPPEWDLQIEITELPYVFRTTLDQLPIAENYLRLAAELIEATAKRMGQRRRPRIGFVWACGDWNPKRNVPLPLLQDVCTDSRFEFWNLQGSGSANEADHLPVRNERDLCEGLVPLAALIANLDLVITPDTLAAHLAGVLGTPAWVMLQYSADWRWLVNRIDSPWYRSLRLFRQPTPGDWRSVISSVQARLHALQLSCRSALLF